MTSSITRTMALLLACVLSAPALAGTFTVTNLNDSGAGSLREAMSLANSNTDVSQINFGVTGTISVVTELPRVLSPITINGGNNITLDGGNGTRIFRVGSAIQLSGTNLLGDLTLDGLTVQNARVAPSSSALDRNPTVGGAGAYLERGRLTVKDSTFRDNLAGNGAAIYALGGGNELTIGNTNFTGNNAANGWGGAIYTDAEHAWRPDGVKVSIDNSTFTNNLARLGGGFAVRDNNRGGGSFSVTNSQFTSNDAIGGGVAYNRATTLLIDGVTMTDNDAASTDAGGAFYFSNFSDATIRNSSITGSDAGYGGAMAVFGGSQITIEDSEISGNNAQRTNVARGDGGDGGAIYIIQGFNRDSGPPTLRLVRSTVSDNNAVNGFGGGISGSEAVIEVIESLIANNTTGGGGGGIYLDREASRLLMQNSTVTGNSTTGLLDDVQGLTEAGRGGGIYFVTGKAIIESSTIANNSATERGGGILLGGNVNPEGLSTILNSILADNTALFGPNVESTAALLDSLGYNLLDDSGEGLFDELTDLLNALADLQALADNGGPTQTLALGLNSDAIDSGFSSLLTDQRGFDRPFGLGPDIGAYEFIPEPGTLALLGLGGLTLLTRRRGGFPNHKEKDQ